MPPRSPMDDRDDRDDLARARERRHNQPQHHSPQQPAQTPPVGEAKVGAGPSENFAEKLAEQLAGNDAKTAPQPPAPPADQPDMKPRSTKGGQLTRLGHYLAMRKQPRSTTEFVIQDEPAREDEPAGLAAPGPVDLPDTFASETPRDRGRSEPTPAPAAAPRPRGGLRRPGTFNPRPTVKRQHRRAPAAATIGLLAAAVALTALTLANITTSDPTGVAAPPRQASSPAATPAVVIPSHTIKVLQRTRPRKILRRRRAPHRHPHPSQTSATSAPAAVTASSAPGPVHAAVQPTNSAPSSTSVSRASPTPAASASRSQSTPSSSGGGSGQPGASPRRSPAGPTGQGALVGPASCGC